MLLGHIPVRQVPEQRPDDANRAENVEHPSPAKSCYDGHRDRGHDGRPQTARTMRNPLGESTLLPRIPELHGPRCRGKRTYLSHAEQKPDKRERDYPDCLGRHGRHDGPKDRDGPQHPSWSKLVAHPAAWDLEGGIAPGESAEDDPHGDLAEAEFPADEGCRRGDVHPVHIGDQVHQAQHEQDVPTSMGGLLV